MVECFLKMRVTNIIIAPASVLNTSRSKEFTGESHFYAFPFTTIFAARRPKVMVRPQARPVNRFG